MSTIAVAEFCVKDSIQNLPLRNILFSPFNAYHTSKSGESAKILYEAVLGTTAQMERDNIKFRLNSGRAKYIAEGGVLGRPVGTKKTAEQLQKDYSKVVRELKKGTSLRRAAKLCDVSLSTVQRVKKALNL